MLRKVGCLLMCRFTQEQLTYKHCRRGQVFQPVIHPTPWVRSTTTSYKTFGWNLQNEVKLKCQHGRPDLADVKTHSGYLYPDK